MGGTIPLGYELRDRKLIVNEAEADIVRDIFRRYLEGDSTKAVAVGLEAAGVRSKTWTTRAGKPMGGFAIGKGAIVHILQSRLYLGEIVHKDLVHPGEHEAIISRETFDAVAARMAGNAAQRRDRPTRAVSGPLTGLIFDGVGQPMSPSFAYGKGGKLYRYYIAMALQTGSNQAPGDDSLRRVSASAVERFLVETLKRLGGRSDIEAADLKGAMRRVELRTTETHLVIDREAVFPGEHPELALTALRAQLREGEQAVTERGAGGAIRLVIPHRLQLRGGPTAIWGGSEDYRHGRINPSLVKTLKQAHAHLATLKASPFTNPDDLMSATAPATQHDRQVCRLALMAPEIQRRILAGHQPRGLRLKRVLKTPMPLAWADQKAWLEAVSRG